MVQRTVYGAPIGADGGSTVSCCTSGSPNADHSPSSSVSSPIGDGRSPSGSPARSTGGPPPGEEIVTPVGPLAAAGPATATTNPSPPTAVPRTFAYPRTPMAVSLPGRAPLSPSHLHRPHARGSL